MAASPLLSTTRGSCLQGSTACHRRFFLSLVGNPSTPVHERIRARRSNVNERMRRSTPLYCSSTSAVKAQNGSHSAWARKSLLLDSPHRLDACSHLRLAFGRLLASTQDSKGDRYRQFAHLHHALNAFLASVRLSLNGTTRSASGWTCGGFALASPLPDAEAASTDSARSVTAEASVWPATLEPHLHRSMHNEQGAQTAIGLTAATQVVWHKTADENRHRRRVISSPGSLRLVGESSGLPLVAASLTARPPWVGRSERAGAETALAGHARREAQRRTLATSSTTTKRCVHAAQCRGASRRCVLTFAVAVSIIVVRTRRLCSLPTTGRATPRSLMAPLGLCGARLTPRASATASCSRSRARVMIRRSASCTRATLLPPRSATDSVARCRRRQKKPTEDELRPRKKVSKTTQASDSVGNWDKLPLCVLLGAAASRLFPGSH